MPFHRSRPAALSVLSVLAAMVAVFAGCGPEVKVTEVTEVKATADDLPADVPPVSVGENDWPWWRGSSRQGIAGAQEIPTEWGPDKNIVWQVNVPGRGHASPTVVGDLVVLATADEEEQTQSVVAFDRETGSPRWTKQLHSGGFPGDDQMHAKSSHASSTIASDGERLFAVFLNHGELHATALDFDGEIVWQETLGAFSPKFGYAPSPVIYESLVIFAADNWGGGYITAHNRLTGDVVWRIKRPDVSTYASPNIMPLGDRDLLVISGCDKVMAYDPRTGDEVWSVEGTAEGTVGTVVYEGNKVVASGGYPAQDTVCINAETGEALWHVPEKVYIPSLLLHDGAVYALTEKGIGFCLSLDDGKTLWKERVEGKFSASPVLVGDKILSTDERGTTVVLRADPTKLDVIAKNKLGDETFASPVVVGGRIYLRVADRKQGTRQEVLYCIGKSEAL